MDCFKDLSLCTYDTPAKEETGRKTCTTPPTATASATPIDCTLSLSTPILVIIIDKATHELFASVSTGACMGKL